jgi:hypothetical protein
MKGGKWFQILLQVLVLVLVQVHGATLVLRPG